MTGTQLMITILGSVGIVSVFGFLTAITLAAGKRAGTTSRPRPSGAPPQWKQGGTQ